MSRNLSLEVEELGTPLRVGNAEESGELCLTSNLSDPEHDSNLQKRKKEEKVGRLFFFFPFLVS